MTEALAIDTMKNVELPEFPELVQAHHRMVFSIACNFLGDRSTAEEAAQDVFMQLYRALPSLESEAHVVAWLCKVTTHRCIDYARRKRHDLALDEIPEPAAECSQPDPFMSRRLARMLASLSPKARAVMILRYQEDLDPEEIARTLGWRLNTVKSQLHRSLAFLRKRLGNVLEN